MASSTSRWYCCSIGNLTGSAAATHAGGWFVFAFVALVGYYYVAALWEETGGARCPSAGRSSADSAHIGALAGWNTPVLSASSSARITCTTALISARWVNACGKLPRWRPVRGSISSA